LGLQQIRKVNLMVSHKMPLPPPNTTGWPWNNIISDIHLQIKPHPDQSHPRITIVTPSFNQGRFIEAAIRSVLLQNYSDLEYIIIDGGSSDNSVAIIEKYQHQITYWVSEPDRGQAHAINKGFSRATGDIIAWLNCDDTYLPNALQHIAVAYKNNPEAALFYGSCQFTDTDRNPFDFIDSAKIRFSAAAILSGEDTPAQPSVFIGRAAYEEAGLFNEELYYSMDWEYWLRLALQFPPSNFIDVSETLSTFNTWEGGKTSSGKGATYVEQRLILDRFFASDAHASAYSHLKSLAYASTYWRQGRATFSRAHIKESLHHYTKAFALKPFYYHPIKMLFTNADIILPENLRRWLNKLLG